MRLAEFLARLLEAHAETLHQLSALVGEERLVELIEDGEEADLGQSAKALEQIPFEPPAADASSRWTNPYQELEGAVMELKLPPVLEFYVWAYPLYRVLIESNHDLNSKIPGPGGDAGVKLVDLALSEAENWLLHLPLPSPLRPHAQRVATIPWLKFRAEVLRRIGKRPLGPVY